MLSQFDTVSPSLHKLARSETPPTIHKQEEQQDRIDMLCSERSLHFLRLPREILQAILKEITHTNDLSALALTHSILYTLVIPHIYARFDIVWPDGNVNVENRVGVDALTYGLATLVMAHDVFGEVPPQRSSHLCKRCGVPACCEHKDKTNGRSIRTRRGNCYAQHIRKFSLGNGPEDWVQEYLITKEGGKMLGTLVALAVGRMCNLETFIWDMPTGVLRDVWLALASLTDRDDGQPCKLEKIWIRWHDNLDRISTAAAPTSSAIPAQSTDLPFLLGRNTTSPFYIPPYPRVVFPTFSKLPPLKSLNVLDIDELSYVEEMSVLIGRSTDCLRELRVGMARHAQHDPWARPREDLSLISPSLIHSAAPLVRAGGLLGILFGGFCSLSDDRPVDPDGRTEHVEDIQTSAGDSLCPNERTSLLYPKSSNHANTSLDDVHSMTSLLADQTLSEDRSAEAVEVTAPLPHTSEAAVLAIGLDRHAGNNFEEDNKIRPPKKLELQILELERVYLSIPVLLRALDWSRLTSITLLGCFHHDTLWKALRRKFAPASRSILYPALASPSDSVSRQRSVSGPSTPSNSKSGFRLKITRIHTDTVSSALLAFIKDTLAPNSVQWLLLQQCQGYKSNVTIDQIHKYAIKPHRDSLTKLLVDSHLKTEDGSSASHWRRWVLNKELITCITSGRMQLRELGMSVDYKDWHYFLQRLPNSTTLRSLHVVRIANYVHGHVDSQDIAQQILDVVALRPELETCYVGVQKKCFEILEVNTCRDKSPIRGQEDIISQATDDESDDSDDSDENDNHNDNDDDDSILGLAVESEDEDSGDESTSSAGSRSSIFKLREILFYDDKVSIFKARHGKL